MRESTKHISTPAWRQSYKLLACSRFGREYIVIPACMHRPLLPESPLCWSIAKLSELRLARDFEGEEPKVMYWKSHLRGFRSVFNFEGLYKLLCSWRADTNVEVKVYYMHKPSNGQSRYLLSSPQTQPVKQVTGRKCFAAAEGDSMEPALRLEGKTVNIASPTICWLNSTVVDTLVSFTFTSRSEAGCNYSGLR